MTLKQLLFFFLQFIFIFVFSACTSSGGIDDEIFQAEEEEYMESQKKQVALGGDYEGDDYEESEVLAESDTALVEGENNLGGDLSDEYGTAGSGENLVNLGAVGKKTWVPLKKIPTQPWRQDGKWVNTVYIAREGDSLNQISVKIYGHARLVDELKNFNPFLKRRGPKVGDKIYYNSPNRPKDRVKFTHYYEDNNQTAVTYDIQAGENIRKIAFNLLGHKDSWKEIWATNPQVESKGNVNETVTVYYWKGSSAVVEDTVPPPVELPQEEVSPEPEMAEIEDPEIPLSEEPPTLDGGGLAVSEEESLPPLPGETSKDVDTIDEESSFASKNANKIKVIAIAGILLILVVFFVRMIRNRKNRADFDFSQTHIDIDNIEE